jgi:signal transduction histidine kinase
MRERLADVGGVCHVESRPDAGCRVTFAVPLAAPQLEQNRLAKIARHFFPKNNSANGA